MAPIDRLQLWLDQSGTTKTALARALGIAPPSVSVWFSRGIRPAANRWLAIERLTGIPAADWMTDGERRVAFGDSDEGAAE